MVTTSCRPAAAMVRCLVALGSVMASCSDYNYVQYEGVDVFYQNAASDVDVLLVVDNSCSMQPYQQKLSQNFDAFLTYFLEGDVNYHIGVVTTTTIPVQYVPNTGCSQQDIDNIPAPGELVGGTWITRDTPDGASVFSSLVKVGTCGSGYEQGLESARLALENSDNSDFLRDDAYLSLIFVSDEEDSSPLKVNEYINDFRNVHGQRARDIFNGSALVVTDPSECSAEQLSAGGGTSGTRYMDVADQTGGVQGNICSSDFEPIITDLSLATSRLKDTFYLSNLPNASSLQVWVNDDEVACDDGSWTYALVGTGQDARGAIVFDRSQMPAPNSKITARYYFGDGDPDSFCNGAGGERLGDTGAGGGTGDTGGR